MSATPSNPRTYNANNGLGLRLTPSNSPYTRNLRASNKSRLFDSNLALRRIVGSTVSSPTAFDTLISSPTFAYCAGAAAVVVRLNPDSDTAVPRQYFFRARPTAIPSSCINAFASLSSAPSTPVNHSNEGRNRTVASNRDSPFTGADSGNSPTSKTWTSRERIKAATCLSLSRDGKLLAVGETGYCPRVLLFPLKDASSETPLAILNEHTYGVRAVAFSPDNAYLASLGTPNDGFLYIWSIGSNSAPTLHSSNKCTSVIRQMVWLGGSVVTVGTRHIKVWRVDDNRNVSSPTKLKFVPEGTPQPASSQLGLKTLSGRNCLLGPLVESTFTCIASISDQKAIVCTDKGEVCILDDSEQLNLTKLLNVGFPITCLAIGWEESIVSIGGRNGYMRTVKLEDLLTQKLPEELSVQQKDANSDLYAMGYAAKKFLTMDSRNLISINDTTNVQTATIETLDDHEIELNTENIIPKAVSKADVTALGVDRLQKELQMIAHGSPVLGVSLLPANNSSDASFLTWSADGTIIFWDLDGRSRRTISAELEQLPLRDEDVPNQCQVVRASRTTNFLAVGDRYGVVKLIDLSTETCVFETKAHGSEITDLALSENDESCLLASSSRDRCVQLYRKIGKTWVLVQTMDEHTSVVVSLCFADQGEILISASSDRSICLRKILTKDVAGQHVMAAVPYKAITSKVSPIDMVISDSNGPSTLIVSFLDRTVATYDVASGRLLSSFRATDGETSEAVVLDALVLANLSLQSGRSMILAGVSSTDKSIRIYDASTGTFLDRQWGHTAAVTGIALHEPPGSDQKILISTGYDGTIMLWDIKPNTPGFQEPAEFSGLDSTPPKEPTSAYPPLRRVLSKAELAEFQRLSPASTPTGRGSPPRNLRRKTSRYGLQPNSPTLPPPSLPGSGTVNYSSVSEEPSSKNRGNLRHHSRSPPSSPKTRNRRRPSVSSLDSRSRTKNTSSSSEFGTLNMATEQACRTLRAYRKKLSSTEQVKDSVLRELDQELRLTAMALGERSLKSQAIGETVLSDLLERISSMFDEKLRLTRPEQDNDEALGEMPDSDAPAMPKIST